MEILFSVDNFNLKPKPATHLREELFVSAFDVHRLGQSNAGQFGIMSVEGQHAGEPDRCFPIRFAKDDNLEPGTLRINESFSYAIGLLPHENPYWSIKHAPSVVTVTEAVIELVVEQGDIKAEIESLRRQWRDLFLDRCLLVEPGMTASNLKLSVDGQAYFNFHSIHPAPETFQSRTLLVFNESTELSLFVPNRKSGVDIVIVIDASGSMDLRDYVDGNRVRSRLEGVQSALDILLERRLVSGGRISSIATVVFGANTRMLYPLNDTAMIELKSESQIEDMRASTRNLSKTGLERLEVDRSHTNISGGLQYAAELLDYYSQENNEKMIILLSDGADWSEDTEGISQGEIVNTTQDPAVLADSLHLDSQIRIHTIAISDKYNVRKYLDRKFWDVGFAIPNQELLKQIAISTEGKMFPSPDAHILATLFDDIGKGATYPLRR